ncbi:MAG TPA: RNA polymerase subunit sigma [Planctomycetaceae bacterium]|nr:RNA polymerase subunit sigma [Planctomycetaceae bacterium]HRF01810.1 ECF-type sigma factor [Pirellulaceae bacterium]
MEDLTRIIAAIDQGDSQAAETLLPMVYSELRRLAAVKLGDERIDHTLPPTALVHEAYLRLCRSSPQGYRDRRHFLAAAAIAMRRVLVDAARAKRTRKRGGDLNRVEMVDPIGDRCDDRMLALDEALARFAEIDPFKARIVELRFFAGLSVDQTAEILGVSSSSVDRGWSYARAWLQAELPES